MTFKRALFLGFVLVLVAIGFSIWSYPQLPAHMPIHWGLDGNADGYGSKFLGVLLGPALMLGFLVLCFILPRVAPKGYRLDQFLEVFGAIQLAVLAMLLVVHILTLLVAAGKHVPMSQAIVVTTGGLIVVLGNYMGKLRKNFFIGIRTPWTLASDEVWARTHRFSGWLLAITGLAIIVEGVLDVTPLLALAPLLVAAVVSIAYSFLLYKRIEGFRQDNSHGTS